MLKALLGNDTMVSVCRYLSLHASGCATDIAREYDIPLNMIQQQLRRLELGHIVAPIVQGRKKVYHWNDELPCVAKLKLFLRETFAWTPSLANAPDAADGRGLSRPQRLRVAEALRREAQHLSPVKPPKPFVQSFESFDAYEAWKKKQTNPWLF
jgi:hypothetical protein